VSRLAGLSVVLVCLNEETKVGRAIADAVTAAARATDDYEVIVVDDGSVDRSLQAASEVARRNPRVRLLVHARVRGYGAAMRTGIGAARKPWILLTDAGLAVDPRELAQLLSGAADADLLVSYPSPSGSFARRVATAARNLLIRRSLTASVRDADRALKLVRRDLIDGLPLSSDGRGIGTELVARAMNEGARVCEARRLPDTAAHAGSEPADGSARRASVV
jgi:glycosyltransferase involved in cell wall biosynthesis